MPLFLSNVKKQVTLGHFLKFNFLEFIRQKLRAKYENLRHGSLYMILKYTQTKFQAFLLSIKRDFHVKKTLLKSQFFHFTVLLH